jgi:hypothetical protein
MGAASRFTCCMLSLFIKQCLCQAGARRRRLLTRQDERKMRPVSDGWRRARARDGSESGMSTYIRLSAIQCATAQLSVGVSGWYSLDIGRFLGFFF